MTARYRAAIAALCAAVRKTGNEYFSEMARYVERYSKDPSALWDQLDGLAEEFRITAVKLRTELIVEPAPAAEIAERCIALDRMGLAAAWLRDALEVAHPEIADPETEGWALVAPLKIRAAAVTALVSVAERLLHEVGDQLPRP